MTNSLNIGTQVKSLIQKGIGSKSEIAYFKFKGYEDGTIEAVVAYSRPARQFSDEGCNHVVHNVYIHTQDVENWDTYSPCVMTGSYDLTADQMHQEFERRWNNA